MEFYVNYDCDVGSENLFEKIVDILSRIAQGKYSKSSLNIGIQPAQELILRTMALETLLNYMKLIDKIIEETEIETEENANNNKDDTQKEIIEEDTPKLETHEKFQIFIYLFSLNI